MHYKSSLIFANSISVHFLTDGIADPFSSDFYFEHPSKQLISCTKFSVAITGMNFEGGGGGGGEVTF